MSDSDLERWQELLRQKMIILDRLWESLDGIWPNIPPVVLSQISDRADSFYQSYWDVFHIAVESKNLEKLLSTLDEPINKAAEHVVEAWRTVAFTRVEQLEARIESTRQSGPAQLADARAALRQAKIYLENGSKEATAGSHSQAINLFKECITKCDIGIDRIDDALRALQNIITTTNISRKQFTVGVVSVIVTIIIAIVGWFIAFRYYLPTK